jgi:hypothetical protein
MKKLLFLAIIIMLTASQNALLAQYKAGDSLKFWTPSYIDWPSLQHIPQRHLTAVCKKAGDHCYVFVEKDAKQPQQKDIDQVVKSFDEKFYDSLTFRYGPVPDALDHDPRIFILVINEPSWGGYYDPAQQMPDSMTMRIWNRHSSEHELVYVSATSFYNAEKITAHEFGHLLHWQQDHSPEPTINPIRYWEVAWIDEQFSTFASVYLTADLYKKDVVDDLAFFVMEPDIPLIYFSNYDQVKLFMLFMFEQYGQWNYIQTLIRNQSDGIEGIAGTLKQLGYSVSFDDVFEQWIIANYIDDPVYENGKYYHAHYNFRKCKESATHTQLPVEKTDATVNPYAADYISFNIEKGKKPFVVQFNGDASKKFRLAFILMNSKDNKVYKVVPVKPDASADATFSADAYGSEYDKVVMVVMSTDKSIPENSTASYSYSAVKKTK